MDTVQPSTVERGRKRNPGAAIETTEITNLDGAKVAWSDVKTACEIEGLMITELCARFKLKYPAVYARATRGKWKVISSIKKRAKELQKREAELTTTAAQWAKRGETHRELVFRIGHEALRKARLKPPHTFREAKLADDMARRACGLDANEGVSQSVLIQVNELIEGHEPEILEADVVDC